MSAASPLPPLLPEEAGRRLREARRVLLAALGPSLAEMLSATPVVGNLRRALPRAELVFLAGPASADAVLDHPDLDAVFTAPSPGLLSAFRRTKLTRRLCRSPFDAALCLSLIPPPGKDLSLLRGLRPGFVAGLDDAPLGRSRALEAFDCVVPFPEDPRAHVVDCHLALLEGLGIPVLDRHHHLGVTPAQKARADQILAGAGLDPTRPILGAHAGGAPRRPERQWPPSHYATVLQRAAREAGYQTVLLGTRADLPTLDAVQALGKAPIPRLLDLPFADYKAVLSRLRFFITHDGDPVHVAAAVGTRSFFIFISTPAWKWAPYGSHVSVWEEAGHPPGPAEAWARIKPLLAEAAGSGTAEGGGSGQ